MGPPNADPVAAPKILHDLLLLCAQRDEPALATFYSLTSPFLWRVASRSLGSFPQAEDALVRTYATVWRKADSFAAAHLTAWCWTLAILTEHLAPGSDR